MQRILSFFYFICLGADLQTDKFFTILYNYRQTSNTSYCEVDGASSSSHSPYEDLERLEWHRLDVSADQSRPCRGRLRIGRGKSRAPVLPRVAGRLLPAPASVVADPVMEPVAVLAHVATFAGLCTPPPFLPVLASVGHPAVSGATAAVAADGAVHMLAGNPLLTCVARTPGPLPVRAGVRFQTDCH
jgi:hypothetical protein